MHNEFNRSIPVRVQRDKEKGERGLKQGVRPSLPPSLDWMLANYFLPPPSSFIPPFSSLPRPFFLGFSFGDDNWRWRKKIWRRGRGRYFQSLPSLLSFVPLIYPSLAASASAAGEVTAQKKYLLHEGERKEAECQSSVTVERGEGERNASHRRRRLRFNLPP